MLDVLKGKHTGISLFTCAYAEPKGFIGNTRDSMILQSHLFSDFGEAHGKNLLFFFFLHIFSFSGIENKERARRAY